MKNLIQAAVVTLFASSAAQAQQAVQWRVQDGGNGHWYGGMRASSELSWLQARDLATSVGGHLATVTSEAEYQLVHGAAGDSTLWIGRVGPWLGGYQDRAAPDYAEPAGGWKWVTGEPWFPKWASGEPNDSSNQEDYLHYFGADFGSPDLNIAARQWNDFALVGYNSWPTPIGLVIEWSADCNSDGIVDYGQCRDGSLPDYNGNNVPDCCESGTPCVVGNYPVQWRTQDGGNGHWYKVDRFGGQLNWASASIRAQDAGGHLACLSSAHENSFVFGLIASDPSAWNDKNGPWIGARREGGTWSWVNGEAWSFTNWCGGTGTVEHRGQYWACSGTTPSDDWNDHFGDVGPVSGPLMPVAAIIEWSADCNGDGVVDYGQILRGQLQDGDGDGVPDVCEQPNCRSSDFFPDRNVNGADLGLLLSRWGTPTQYTVADLNRDGVVDGIDLGLFLSFWGPCPY